MAPPTESREAITVWLITEYEPARKLITHTLKADGRFRLVGQASSPMEATLRWSTQPHVVFVDAYFMDVPIPTLPNEMKLDRNARSPLLVLIGKRDFPAADAFDIGAIDYVDYRSDQERLRVTLERLRRRLD